MNETVIAALTIIVIAELGVIVYLIQLMHIANRETLGMTDRLAMRIQAPQLAAIEHANEESDSPLYAPPALIPDDDDAYWESREALADRAMSEEVNGGDR